MRVTISVPSTFSDSPQLESSARWAARAVSITRCTSLRLPPIPRSAPPARPSSSLRRRFSLVYSSTCPSRSPSFFCRALTGNVRIIAMDSATSVVSKAVAKPPVMPRRAFFITLISLDPSSVPVKLPTAALTPITVPRKPRIGIAQIKTWNIV